MFSKISILVSLVASISISSIITQVSATPISVLVPRIVYNPHIFTPDSSTVWYAGSRANATWNTTGLPSGLKGRLVLGHIESGSTSEHLNQTLASSFPLSDGIVKFTVPADVEPRNDYIVVLFGDSGNASKKFTIRVLGASRKKNHVRDVEAEEREGEREGEEEGPEIVDIKRAVWGDTQF